MIEIYTKKTCGYCHMAKRLLNAKQADYNEIDVTFDQNGMQKMIQRSNRRTVPQIFINGESIGGFTELAGLEHNGELDKLLNDQVNEGE